MSLNSLKFCFSQSLAVNTFDSGSYSEYWTYVVLNQKLFDRLGLYCTVTVIVLKYVTRSSLHFHSVIRSIERTLTKII